jgi:hypothetical protein
LNVALAKADIHSFRFDLRDSTASKEARASALQPLTIGFTICKAQQRHLVEFRHFEIENFRGINKVKLSLSSSPKSKVA